MTSTSNWLGCGRVRDRVAFDGDTRSHIDLCQLSVADRKVLAVDIPTMSYFDYNNQQHTVLNLVDNSVVTYSNSI